MRIDQMRSETHASFLDDISHSADSVFMAHKLIKKYSDETLSLTKT